MLVEDSNVFSIQGVIAVLFSLPEKGQDCSPLFTDVFLSFGRLSGVIHDPDQFDKVPPTLRQN